MSALKQLVIPLTILAVVVVISVQCQINSELKYSYSGQSRRNRGSSDVVFPDDVPGAIRFDDRERTSRQYSRDVNQAPQIPLDIIKQINNVTDYESFFNILDKDAMNPQQVLVSRIGGESVERSLSKRPTPANCLPEMTVVPLKLEDENESRDPTIVIFPSCTRVNRCGGCCNNNLLSCQPVATQQITFEVYKSQYQGGNKLKFINRELVFVDEHTKCKCDCRKKESDCTKFQRYDKSQCMCNCVNLEDKNKCLGNDQKIWDANDCLCKCREEKDCTTGAYFDQNLCRCMEAVGVNRNTPVYDRKKFIIKPYQVPETPQTFYQTDP